MVEATERGRAENSLPQARTVTGRDGYTLYGLPAGAARPAREPGGATGEIAMTGSGPPSAPRGPGADPYAWMRDRDQPQLREYLAAERAYYDERRLPRTRRA